MTKERGREQIQRSGGGEGESVPIRLEKERERKGKQREVEERRRWWIQPELESGGGGSEVCAAEARPS